MMIDTLKHIQARENLTDQQFADKLGIHRISWNKIKNYRKAFGTTFLKKVRLAYPELKPAVDSYLLGDIGLLIIHSSHKRLYKRILGALYDFFDGIYQWILNTIYDWAKRG